MTEHTPGPWTTDTTHKNTREGVTVWARDIIIADVLPDQHDNAEANARLIASGPDLLAALQDIIEYSKGGTWSPGDRANALRRGEAAIVKATGESQ